MKRVITQSGELVEGIKLLGLEIVKVAVAATTEDGVKHVLGLYDSSGKANKEMMNLFHYDGEEVYHM